MSSPSSLFGTESKATEIVAVRRRIAFMAFILLLLFIFVGARIFILQVLQHDRYSTLARENHVRVQPVPPPRGRIYSSDDVLLAGNLPSYDLVLHREYLDLETEESISTLFAQLLPQLDLAEVLRRHTASGTPRHEPVLLWPGLDNHERDRIMVRRHQLPGVDVVTSSRRHYPLGDAGLHLLGYVSGISAAELGDERKRQVLRIIGHSGKAGIELEYEDWLRGIPGSNNVEVDAIGRSLGILSGNPPQPGNDLRLSIDASLQLDAYHALGGRRGAVVAIEVASGKVRAMVSSPAFDPNFFATGIAAENTMLKSAQGNLFQQGCCRSVSTRLNYQAFLCPGRLVPRC